MLVKRTPCFTDEVTIEAGQRPAPPLRKVFTKSVKSAASLYEFQARPETIALFEDTSRNTPATARKAPVTASRVTQDSSAAAH
jgi:hypothetical protein